MSASSQHFSLPPRFISRLHEAFPNKPGLTICEINVRNLQFKQSLLTTLGKRAASKYRGIRFVSNASDVAQSSDNSIATVAEWTVLAAPLSVTRRLLRREPCHIVVVDMNGDTAADRTSLQLDLAHQMALTSFRSGSLFALHGPASCNALDMELYRYEGYGRLREQCWHASWDRLVRRGDLRSPECESHGRERWCSGLSDVKSLCKSATPMLDALREVRRTRVNLTDGLPRQPCYASHAFVSEQVACQARFSYRYYSIIPCDPAGQHGSKAQLLCLLFKDSLQENWVGGLTSTDGGRSFVGKPVLVVPNEVKGVLPPGAVLPHNYALLRRNRSADGLNRSYLLVGGLHRRKAKGLRHNGVWMAEGSSWRWSDEVQTELLHRTYIGRGAFAPLATPQDTQWRNWRLVVDGYHPGCIERRSKSEYKQLVQAGVCEFDGRLSLAELRGELLLYVRANTASIGGGRYVQVTTSQDNGKTWSPFRMIEVVGLAPSEAEVYFWAAHSNPAHGLTLIALAPIVHHGRGCIGLSLSVDGHTWGAPTPLLQCDVRGERSMDHPVAGMIVSPAGTVLVFVHHEVPFISQDKRAPIGLSRYLMRREFKHGGATLWRYELPCTTLADWTIEQLTLLASRGSERARTLAAAGATMKRECRE